MCIFVGLKQLRLKCIHLADGLCLDSISYFIVMYPSAMIRSLFTRIVPHLYFCLLKCMASYVQDGLCQVLIALAIDVWKKINNWSL